jgi:4-aminobutyrate aminotransferase-like enzyme/murein DD-endopeptidase MepM/ murein hydrolase activator NlpD
VAEHARRELLGEALRRFRALEPAFATLPRSLIHNDANDHNVLVAFDGDALRVTGLLDLGDLVESATVCEPAIAIAYALLDADDPLSTAAAVTRGYHTVRPLGAAELDVLWELALARLSISVAMSAWQRRLEPDNDYLAVSEDAAWRALPRLMAIPARLARAVLRDACGLDPVPRAAAVVAALDRVQPRPLLGRPLAEGDVDVLDLSIASPLLADPEQIDRLLAARLAPGSVAVGRWDEARLVYTSAQFATDGGERRTIHLGVDLFAAPGESVHAPLDGEVHSVADNRKPLDYGPTVMMRHRLGDAEFVTLYGHLSRDSIAGLAPGQRIAAGRAFARIGSQSENGGWPPHVHFQLVTDDLGLRGDFPGVAPPSQARVWRALSPDPSRLAGLPQSAAAPRPRDLCGRRARLPANLSLSYRAPLHLVRGRVARLYDADGRAFVDLVNNVCHVGHCHPRVVRAAADQLAVLNTNTRYLHENILRYAERLAALLPASLSVVFLTNSGSEANDLALRLAFAHTRRRDVIVLDGAYHGNLSTLVDVSPYKHDGPGGRGAPPWVHAAAMPDAYRGPHRGADAGARYAADVERLAEAHPPAAFLHETLLGCGGQIVPPDGWLAGCYDAVRVRGGLCIADEVQTGFGRVGARFWAFELQGVVPDVVTLGKPIGNGHPLGAIVTTPEIARSFANGMEYFNTFGGNPVSCAVGLAVLDVIRDERLQERAEALGERLLAGLGRLRERHALVGDVRGAGLFVGVELVRDRRTLAPASGEAAWLCERMKDRGFLLSTDGPLHNVLKIKPPLAIDATELDAMVAALDDELGSLPPP